MSRETGSVRSRGALAAHLIFICLGLVLLAWAASMGKDWFDRHFLPVFARSHSVQWVIINIFRALVGALGLFLLLFVRPRVAAAIKNGRGRRLLATSLTTALALAAALATTEAILRTKTWRATQENPRRVEPLRQRDAELGWTLVPNHLGHTRIGGRMIEYATDSHGYRVHSADEEVGLDQPQIIFVGESVMFGYGLPWQETIPAQVASITGRSTVNLAVTAYATDQAHLRLKRELPRFRAPAAVIILFSPLVFDRDLDRDRPHLDSGLNWHPGQAPALRLVELVRRVARYRSEEAIAQGIATTQATLKASIELAKARKADAFILVPQFMPEERSEREIRHRVLDEGGLPYLQVRLDSRWRIPGDHHPDARASRHIASQIAYRLGQRTGTTVN